MNRIIKSLMIALIKGGLNYLYNKLDTDGDNNLSKEELTEAYVKFKKLMKKIKN